MTPFSARSSDPEDRYRFLLVDGSESDRARVKKELEREFGASTFHAVETPEALRDSLSKSWTAILIDETPALPIADALGLVREIYPLLPVIVVSENLETELAVAAIKRGAHDFIDKDHLDRLPAAVERARREAAAHHEAAVSQARFRATFEQKAVGIVHGTLDNKILRANRGFAHFIGYEPEELPGRAFRDLTYGDDHVFDQSDMARLVASDATIHYEKRFRHKNGSPVWVSCTLARANDPDASEPYIIGVLQEISARKEAEEQLRSSEVRYRELMEQASEAIFIADETLRYSDVNSRACELTGYSRDELTKLNVDDLLPPDAAPLRLSEVRNGQSLSSERTLLRADGTAFDVELSTTRLSDGRYLAIVRDISERKQAEQRLRASEERLRLVSQATNDAIFDWDVENRTIWVNDRMRDLFGEPPTAIDAHIGWWMDRIHPEDCNRAVGHRLNGLFGDGAFEPIEYRMTREEDGSVVMILERTFVVRSNLGKTVRVVGTITDLTAFKTAQTALSRSEEKFLRLFESSTVGISFWRNDGQVVDANDAYLAIVGYDREAMTRGGLNWRDITSRRNPGELPEENELAARGVSRPFRKYYRRADGSEVPVLVTTSALAGDAYDGFSVVLDMTQQELATATMRANEERLRLLIENSHDIIMIMQPDGTINFVSSSIERSLGYTPEELIGKNTFDWMHPDDAPRVMEVLRSSVVDGLETAEAEYRYRHRDGTWRWLESVGRNLMAKPGIDGIVVNSRDVTERRLWQRRLEQAERLSSLGRLAATIAHEFNNVLMGIQPFAEVLRRKLSDDERVVNATQHIETSVKRGRRITQEILRFTQAAEPTLSPVAVDAWLRELEPELTAHMSERTTLHIDEPPGNLWIQADKLQLSQAVTNLVLNARDAMPTGGTVRIGLGGTLPGSSLEITEIINPLEFVHLWVRDEGEGIPAGVQQRLFEPLFTTKRGGTGLGLPIVHQIMTRHGGYILVESEAGQGSTFHLLIPRAQESIGDGDEALATTDDRRRGTRILLVEDEIAVAEGIEAILSVEGFVVRVVNHGLDAEPAIDAFDPAIVILDVGLPDINGVELYERLSATRPRLPFVFSTGHGDALELGSSPGTVRFLRKPYTSDALLATLDELLQS